MAGDTDTSVDVYERVGGTTNLVSAGTPGNGAFDASFAGNSSDGTRVWFETRESLQAGDTDSAFDVYERSGGTTTRLSTGPGGGNAAIDAIFVGASPDGLRVVIETTESLVVVRLRHGQRRLRAVVRHDDPHLERAHGRERRDCGVLRRDLGHRPAHLLRHA